MTNERKFIVDVIEGKEIGEFTFRITPGKYWCEFEVFEIVSNHQVAVGEIDTRNYYTERGAPCNMDMTFELDKAKRFISGQIKWDGCSEIDFFPDDAGREHFCGKKHAVKFSTVLGLVYDHCRTRIEKIDEKCYE